MAWAAPHTYVAGEPLLSSQLNQDLNYNMMQTMPAKATNEATDNPLFFLINGNNSITGRERGYQFIKNIGTRLGATFGDCSQFVGPTVTLDTGSVVLVLWGCQPASTSLTGVGVYPAAHEMCMSYAVSGASSLAASEERSLLWMTARDGSGSHMGYSQWDLRTDVTPGVNTFTAKYRCRSFDDGHPDDTGEWRWPSLIVIPL